VAPEGLGSEVPQVFVKSERGDHGWFLADGDDAALAIEDPVHRAKVRSAVMRYVKEYGKPPSEMTRKVIWAMFGDDAVDGFDEGVDLAYRE
jgi:hypothetical protein